MKTPKKHECKNPVELPKDDYLYGAAIDNLFYDEEAKCWIADNGEYGSPIAFCPWCGERLK